MVAPIRSSTKRLVKRHKFDIFVMSYLGVSLSMPGVLSLLASSVIGMVSLPLFHSPTDSALDPREPAHSICDAVGWAKDQQVGDYWCAIGNSMQATNPLPHDQDAAATTSIPRQ